MSDFISICIKTAESTLFEGKVQSLSSVNDAGPFDILPFHENFISLIQKQVSIVEENGTSKLFPIHAKGILRVGSNKASIFLGVEVVGV